MGIKILLADDSVTAQNMGKKILSEAGHDVVTVSNGAAAAKKIAEIKPELVLLDVFMPGYSGLELCEKLRNAAETSKIPVLLTVGRMEPYNAQDGARVKADGVIVKPFEATDLTAAVDRIAEKVKPGKTVQESAGGIKIVENHSEASSVNAAGSVPAEKVGTSETAQQEEKPYDKTIRLNSAHIQAMLQQGPGTNEAASAIENSIQASSSAASQLVPDFHVGPAHAAELDGLQEPVGFKAEPEVKAAEASIPSFMSQYLSETREERLAETGVAAPLEPSMHEQPTHSFPVHNDFSVGQSPNEIHGERRHNEETSSSVPELELTAAAPVPDVPIAPEPGLELTRQSASSSTEIALDPALETDPHRATTDFPTRFGTTEAELANQFLESLQHPTGNSAAPVDEFEARLNAAMESYEAPSTELPSEVASPNAELLKAASHFETEATPSPDSFEAQVEAAMHGFDSSASIDPPVAPSEIVPEPTLEVAQAASETHSAEFQIAPVIEMPVRHREPGTVEHASAPVSAELEPATDSIEIVAPEPDDAVIQQMREGLSHHPVEAPQIDTAAPAPMAMAAAASAASNASQSLAHDAEAEIGRAMAAATGLDITAQPEQPGTSAEPNPAHDANHLAGAVESVMKRELPNLIWKIMAELDLRKRS